MEETKLQDSMILRRFTASDLVMYHNFASKKENKNKSHPKLIREYMNKNPELSSQQQLENVFKGLKINHPKYNPQK